MSSTGILSRFPSRTTGRRGNRRRISHPREGNATRRFASVLGIPLAFTLLPGITEATEEEVFSESVVIFNTICARCHEAECSGRLSFADDLEASTNHIVRHYGDASGKKWLQEQLFAVLGHMKEKCAYYPMNVPVPPQRVWESELLDTLSTYLQRNYFIPVGSLSPGRYRLELTLEQDTKVTLHVVSESFAMVVEDCYKSDAGRLQVPFTIEETENHYVRIYPDIPVKILRLAIIPL